MLCMRTGGIVAVHDGCVSCVTLGSDSSGRLRMRTKQGGVRRVDLRGPIEHLETGFDSHSRVEILDS